MSEPLSTNAHEPVEHENETMQEEVVRLRKLANLAMFLIVLASFVAIGARATVDWNIESENTRATLRVARLGLPFMCLILTAIVTARSIATVKMRRGGEVPDAPSLMAAFQRGKLTSIISLLLAGLFAASGLLEMHARTIDYLSPVLAILFIIIGRPTWLGFMTFVGMVTESHSHDEPPTESA
ncbi:MAG: hypothetical protein AB7N71_11555 [Phycisphaerae bacterium]